MASNADKTWLKPLPPSRSACMACFVAICCVLCTFILAIAPTTSAYAEDIDTNPQPDELQQRVEQTAQAYEEAVAQVESLQADIEENGKAIEQLEKQLPAQQRRSNNAARDLYKMQNQQFSFIEFLLAAEDLQDFLRMLEYATHVTDSNMAEMTRLQSMMDDLQSSRNQLEQDKAAADDQAAEAEKALQEAQAARLEAQRKAEEEARRRAEAAAAAAAAAQAAAQRAAEVQAAQAQATQGSSASSASVASASSDASAVVDPDSTIYRVLTPDGANWAVTEEEFIAAWAPRIDAYLSGWPLAGQGKTFAKAAWDYGIDPRFSPAISCVESSKGSACFLPHNAWGWGSVSWDNWEEAINDHVRGLARGYGYTVTPEGAAKYCPGTSNHWYNRVVEEMNQI